MFPAFLATFAAFALLFAVLAAARARGREVRGCGAAADGDCPVCGGGIDGKDAGR